MTKRHLGLDKAAPQGAGALDSEGLLVTVVAQVVRDYFGYPGNDYGIPCDEVVATRLGQKVLQRVQESGLELYLKSPSPSRRV